MATKKLARYARGFWAGGGSWSGAGAPGRSGQWASTVSAFILYSPGVSDVHCVVGLKGLCLDLCLEPQAVFCARVEEPGFGLCGLEPLSAHSRPRETNWA